MSSTRKLSESFRARNQGALRRPRFHLKFSRDDSTQHLPSMGNLYKHYRRHSRTNNLWLLNLPQSDFISVFRRIRQQNTFRMSSDWEFRGRFVCLLSTTTTTSSARVHCLWHKFVLLDITERKKSFRWNYTNANRQRMTQSRKRNTVNPFSGWLLEIKTITSSFAYMRC